jgi:hypothetical protein
MRKSGGDSGGLCAESGDTFELLVTLRAYAYAQYDDPAGWCEKSHISAPQEVAPFADIMIINYVSIAMIRPSPAPLWILMQRQPLLPHQLLSIPFLIETIPTQRVHRRQLQSPFLSRLCTELRR